MSLTVWQFDPVNITPYYNLALCEALAIAGCKVRYITSRFLYDENLPYSPHIQTDFLYFRALEHAALVKFPRLRRLLRAIDYPLGHYRFLARLRKQPPDILHIQWSRIPRFDLPLVQRVKALGIPIVFTVHETIPIYESKNIQPKLEQIYASADRLIVHTEANRADLLERCPAVDPARVRVVPLINAPNTAVPSGANRMQARTLLELPQDSTLLLFFGGIRYYKGLDILAKAFEIVLQRRSDLRLLVAGRADSSEDAAVLERLKQQANVAVHSKFIPYDRVWQYYYASDLVLFPYRHSYQSAALMTAMDFGCPVVVTEVGGLPETVDGNGWVVPPEDPTALANAILEAVSDTERLQRMGQRSRQLVDERYEGSVIARQMIAVYRELTGNLS
jgi:glycosyltransferase involved in cell wall biosynthesis